MRHCAVLAALAVAALLVPATAAAGPIGLAIGAYGGVNLAPIDDFGFGDAESSALAGAKLRVIPPGGFFAVEAHYTRVTREDAQEVWDQGDLDVVLHGDGFDLYSADLLFGNPGGPGPMRMFVVAGVNVKELSELEGDAEFKPGAEVGAGLELSAPGSGISVEVRGTLVWLEWTELGDPEFLSLTAGLNYLF